MLKWFNVRNIAEAGHTLADQVPQSPVPGANGKQGQLRKARRNAVGDFFRRAGRDPRIVGLNFIKRAWLANSFKWRLLENGVDSETANEWTQTLVLEISRKKSNSPAPDESMPTQLEQPLVSDARRLSALADESYARGAYAEAVTHLQGLVAIKPHDATALNALGAALVKVARYKEAEDCFGKAVRRRSDYPEAHGNLGAVYLAKGQFLEAEVSLRRALKARPADPAYRCNLATALLNIGRLQ